MYDEVREQLIAYYQQELNYTKVGLVKETNPIERGKMCWYALQRCLGACQFAQMMGLPFEIAEMLFEAMRTNLQELENGG
jgi:hypothetical protein